MIDRLLRRSIPRWETLVEIEPDHAPRSLDLIFTFNRDQTGKILCLWNTTWIVRRPALYGGNVGLVVILQSYNCFSARMDSNLAKWPSSREQASSSWKNRLWDQSMSWDLVEVWQAFQRTIKSLWSVNPACQPPLLLHTLRSQEKKRALSSLQQIQLTG